MEKRNYLDRYKSFLVGICVLALALVYVFQKIDYFGLMLSIVLPHAQPSAFLTFIVDKAVRLVVNDLICFFLIFVLFREKKYLRVAFVVFCFEFFLVLPVYLLLKLSMEGSGEISSPLLSQIHRLIVNPMLMFILIVGFYFQRSGFFKSV